MKTTLALVAVSAAVAGTQLAFASGGGNSTPTDPTTRSRPDTCDRASDHRVLHSRLARKRWQERRPLAGTDLCLPRSHIAKHKRSLELYREYRRVAPYRCHSGSEGWYAIPCYVIECESHFNWFAANPSGAVGVYQLLGWGAPYPARTFRQRLANHRIAASLSLSNWVCA